jgi:hypothetical protein
MAIFYAIMTGQKNAPRATATLDVAIDPEPGESLVRFRVFVDGALLPAPADVATVNGFATSGNLFTGVPDLKNALVQATVEQPSAPASAVLRQKVAGGAKILLGVGAEEKATSTRVAVAVGELLSGTHLLIANVGDVDAAIDIVVGNLAPVGNTRVGRKISNPRVPPKSIWQVPLQAGDEQSHVLVRSTTAVLVQLTSDDGKVDEATVFPS